MYCRGSRQSIENEQHCAFWYSGKNDGSVADRKRNDDEQIADIMKHIGVEGPRFSNVQRLGRSRPGGHSRPLRLYVKDLDMKRDILRNSRLLRNSTKLSKAFLKEDLTPSQ